jgi:hypothetical protein
VRSLPAPPARLAGLGPRSDESSLLPNVASLLDKADLRAASALFPERYRRYMGLVDGADAAATSVTLRSASDPLVDLAGASAIVTEDGVAPNPRAAPRVFFPSTIERVADETAAAARLRGALPVAVVEGDAPAGTGTARITSYAAGRVTIAAVADTPALVVLTDTYDDGWHAAVDGLPARVLPVDVLFRGVVVPAGAHEIAFTYRPASVVAGGWISALALAACALGAWRRRRGR